MNYTLSRILGEQTFSFHSFPTPFSINATLNEVVHWKHSKLKVIKMKWLIFQCLEKIKLIDFPCRWSKTKIRRCKIQVICTRKLCHCVMCFDFNTFLPYYASKSKLIRIKHTIRFPVVSLQFLWNWSLMRYLPIHIQYIHITFT